MGIRIPNVPTVDGNPHDRLMMETFLLSIESDPACRR